MTRRAVLITILSAQALTGLALVVAFSLGALSWSHAAPGRTPPGGKPRRPDAAIPSGPCPWETARACPISTLAFAAARHPDTLAARMASSPAGLSALAQAAWLKSAAERRLGASLALWVRLGSFPATEATLALTELEARPGSRPVPHLLLVMKGDETALEAAAKDCFAKLKADEPTLKGRETRFEKDTVLHLLGDEEVSLGWAVQDGMLILASHESTLRQALQALSENIQPLSESAPFRALCGTLGSDALLYVRENPPQTGAFGAGFESSEGVESLGAASKTPVAFSALANSLLKSLELQAPEGMTQALDQILTPVKAPGGLLLWKPADPSRIPLFLSALQDAP